MFAVVPFLYHAESLQLLWGAGYLILFATSLLLGKWQLKQMLIFIAVMAALFMALDRINKLISREAPYTVQACMEVDNYAGGLTIVSGVPVMKPG